MEIPLQGTEKEEKWTPASRSRKACMAGLVFLTRFPEIVLGIVRMLERQMTDPIS